MLSTIEAVLGDLKLIDGSEPLRHCISISNGNTVSLSVFLDAKRFFQVKASEIAVFEGEYDAHVRGWKQYGDMVPRPIGRQLRNGWDVFVAQGVNHKPFVFDTAGRNSDSNRVLGGIDRFFVTSAGGGIRDGNQQIHESFLDLLCQHYSNGPLASIADYWVRQGRALGICDLPAIAQHGDFVENNIGYDKDRLLIFDWEDFGKYQLPGLDVGSFCFSIMKNIDDLSALMTADRIPENSMGMFVANSCNAMNIDPNFFRRLLPLYLLVFLHAKQEYSAAIQGRICTVLRQLSPTVAV